MKQLLKSLKQQEGRQEEAEQQQALLCHHNNSHMEDPPDSGEQREVVVKIDSGNGENASNPNAESSGGKLSGSSKKFKLSFEQVLNEAVCQRSKDLPDQEISQLSSGSGGEDLFRSSSRYFTRRNSWRLLVDKTKSRLIDPPDDDDSGGLFRRGYENEEDDIQDIPEEFRNLKFNTMTILQWVSLALIIAAFVCSLSIPVIKRQTLWDLPLWKWELLAFSLICGRLVSGWGIRVVVILIERRFLLRKRVLYFVYGLRKAAQNCLWLGLVLLAWHCIFDAKVEEETKSKVLPYVNKILVCFVVGTLIWLLKTFLVKVLASSFHVNTFFERIQDALFNQYVIETLSGPPSFERHNTQQEQEGAIPETRDQKFKNSGTSMPGELRKTLLQGSGKLQKCPTVGKKPRFSRTMSKKKHEEIPIDHLHKLNQKNISAWNMKRMINIVRHGSLSTLDEHVLSSDMEDESMMEIRSEFQAKEAAKKIFLKVAKPGSQFISLDDLMCFMGKEEALKTTRLFGASCQNEGISKSALNSWLVNAFRERRALALSLNDTKTAVDELHNMLNILVSIIIVLIWLVILGIQITHFLVFISSQLLLAVFIFGNTCKTVFEAIIFLFIMHPFDVGDRCEVDGVQLIVEEMNILTTVFLRCTDNQKITYPNSVLSTKAIGNFYRSPDMHETIEFCVHISTPMEKIATMKRRIIGYIESNKEQWHQPPMVAVKDVEDMNKVNMILCVTHRLNFHNSIERFIRRAQLIEEMIKVFKELDLQYRMLPLDVNVRNMPVDR